MFFAGHDRSGIGLVGELFEAHPQVAITRRTNFWSFYADRYGDLAVAGNLRRCVDDMLRYTRFSRLGIDSERLVADFTAGERSYARLFSLVQEQNMQRLGKVRWGDKSLGAEHHADEILAAFPDAVMIHVLRDPRDAFASRAGHRTPGRGGIGSVSAGWRSSARRARRNLVRHPDRYRVVRYEDLIDDPEAVVVSLCEFVGVDYTPAMFHTPDGPRRFHRDSIGRYSRDLRPEDTRFQEAALGGEMRRWGYEPSRPTVKLSALPGYALTQLPWAVAGFVSLAPRAALTRRRGGTPSDRRSLDDP